MADIIPFKRTKRYNDAFWRKVVKVLEARNIENFDADAIQAVVVEIVERGEFTGFPAEFIRECPKCLSWKTNWIESARTHCMQGVHFETFEGDYTCQNCFHAWTIHRNP